MMNQGDNVAGVAVNGEAAESRELRGRIRQVLVGVAYGDAMGMPTETLTRQQIAHYFGRVVGFNPSVQGPDIPFTRHFLAGQVTDDTDNTLMLCRMLIERHGEVDAGMFVEYLIRWLDEDPSSGFAVGPSTRRAVDAIRKGVSMNETGRTGTTNGASMKISPIGIVDDYRHLTVLLDDVAAICLPTHNTTIAIQGAAAVACAVSYAIRVPSVDWDEWYRVIDKASSQASSYGQPFPSADLARRIAYGRTLAEQIDDDQRFEDTLYSVMGTGMETIETVPAAMSIVYRYHGTLSRCIECCANLGGDTDTIGAICGAMCGAIDGDVAADRVNVLEEVNHVDFDALAFAMAEVADRKTGLYTEGSAQ